MSSDYELLIELADALDASGRAGAEKDEPEGARYITWSDTAARLVSTELREIARCLEVPETGLLEKCVPYVTYEDGQELWEDGNCDVRDEGKCASVRWDCGICPENTHGNYWGWRGLLDDLFGRCPGAPTLKSTIEREREAHGDRYSGVGE